MTNNSNIHTGTGSPYQEDQDGSWILAASYGQIPHPMGLQEVTQESAHQMVKQFHSMRGILSRAFGGPPIYIGHPDDPAFKNQPGHTDDTPYGYIKKLRYDSRGLWAKVDMTRTGKQLIKNGLYKYISPRWAMRKLGANVYEPIKLLSLGLTNRPNIAGSPKLPTTIKGNVPDNIKVEPITGHITFANSPSGRKRGRFALADKIEHSMQENGTSYVHSWMELKRKQPELFNTFIS